MSDGAIIAIITGVFTLIGTIVTVIVGNNKAISTMDKNQAVTATKLEALTEEVKKHNNFAQRMPVVEANIDALSKRVESIEKRVG